MNWTTAISDFTNYLRLERGLSSNTVTAYRRDLHKLAREAEAAERLNPLRLELKDLEALIKSLSQEGLQPRSQARLVSTIRSFYKFLVLEDLIERNPAELIESPRTGRKLPVYLSDEEVNKMITAIDLSMPEGHRNQAIIECLYASGLRVSELINLRISDLFFKEGVIRVMGKGSKERLVPIHDKAIASVERYRKEVRSHIPVQRGHEDHLFLNRRGKKLSRAMIFHIVRQLAELAGIKKVISPHSLRHSFATALVSNGADLRAVQQMLGHESITTTEIYTHLDQSQLSAVIKQFHPRSGQ